MEFKLSSITPTLSNPISSGFAPPSPIQTSMPPMLSIVTSFLSWSEKLALGSTNKKLHSDRWMFVASPPPPRFRSIPHLIGYLQTITKITGGIPRGFPFVMKRDNFATLLLDRYEEIKGDEFNQIASMCPELTEISFPKNTTEEQLKEMLLTLADLCPKVQHFNFLNLRSRIVSAEHIEIIGTKFPELRNISLRKTKDENSLLAIAQHCKGITSLTLYECEPLNDQLGKMVTESFTEPRHLGLNVAKLPKLEQLSLAGASVTFARTVGILHNNKSITSLYVIRSDLERPQALEMRQKAQEYAQKNPGAFVPSYSDCLRVRDAPIPLDLGANITSLDLNKSMVEDEFVITIVKNSTRLKNLRLRDCFLAKLLPIISSISSLELEEIDFTNTRSPYISVMQLLQKNPMLTSLSLAKTQEQKCAANREAARLAAVDYINNLPSNHQYNLTNVAVSDLTSTECSLIIKYYPKLKSLSADRISSTNLIACIQKNIPFLTFPFKLIINEYTDLSKITEFYTGRINNITVKGRSYPLEKVDDVHTFSKRCPNVKEVILDPGRDGAA